MRKRLQEVTDSGPIDEIIEQCDCCRIALIDGDRPYIVPLNFGYVRKGRQRLFYFHGAAQGRKIDLIRRNRYAGFELDCRHQLHVRDEACQFSFGYRSVVGTGIISLVEDDAEKTAALRAIMAHYSERTDWRFAAGALAAVAIIKLEVETLSGKQHD